MQTPQDFTVPVDWVRDMIEVAQPERPVLSLAMERAELHWSDLSEDGKMIGQRQEVRFLVSLSEQSDDPFFAANLGLRLPGRTSTIVSYVKHGSRNISEAMQAVARLIRLTRPGAVIGFEEDRGVGKWMLANRDPWVSEFGWYQEFVTSAVLRSFRRATGQEVRPMLVHLRPTSGGREAGLSKLWGGPVEASAERHCMTFSSTTMALPLVSYDPSLLEHLRRYGEILLEQLPDPEPSLRHQVERAILDHLVRGAPPIADVAGDLGLSTRTLNRRLTDEGLTYRGLIEDVRRRKAELMLADPKITLAEVTFMLGYVEQSSFTNAFRRWTGESPGAWRSRRHA